MNYNTPANLSPVNQIESSGAILTVTTSYDIRISQVFTSSYDISLAKLTLSSSYTILTSTEFTSSYNIGTGISFTSSYSIPQPSVSFTSSYDIPFRTDSVVYAGFELLHAEYSDNGEFDISPVTSRGSNGMSIVIPQSVIGYSNTFNAITLSVGDILNLKDVLAKGWYTLNVKGELFDYCVISSLKFSREALIDYYYYTVGFAQDTRFLSTRSTVYDGATLSNARRTSRFDSGISSITTGTISGNRMVGASPKVAWGIEYECLTTSTTEITNLLTKLNRKLTLVDDGKTYLGMVITSFQEGNTYTATLNGSVVTITEYSIGFTQDTRTT